MEELMEKLNDITKLIEEIERISDTFGTERRDSS